jgi:cysteinyl-tRNA synthetase
MQQYQLKVFNTLTRQKEVFEPLNPPFVGMYVCGPTVYSDVHLGNCRTFTSFDIMYRFLLHLGYRVRYVRNITDAGHLEDDADAGDDKIGKKARLEKLEPMEIVQRYTVGFHDIMRLLNNLPPSIEPTATGHIVEQIEVVERILKRGYAYQKDGTVYFNTLQFAKDYAQYGQLSGKRLDDLLAEQRELKNQDEKNHPADFALWIKAQPSTLQTWKSPWGVGFPGWHLECSAMSTKYLGNTFDIHGGGLDLQFPHHENEIAQNIGCCGETPARYWLHTNMLTVDGVKMSKSKNNSILPMELFTGNNKVLSKAYSPMTVRFFNLQTHYSSTLDFSDDALMAAEKGYKRLMEARKALAKLTYQPDTPVPADDAAVNNLCNSAYEYMCDDFSTPQALASLFELTRYINTFANQQVPVGSISEQTFARLQTVFEAFITDIFGLKDEENYDNGVTDTLMQLIVDIRKTARERKDWDTSDKIRDALKQANIQLKDGKDTTSWTIG